MLYNEYWKEVLVTRQKKFTVHASNKKFWLRQNLIILFIWTLKNLNIYYVTHAETKGSLDRKYYSTLNENSPKETGKLIT